MQLRRLRLTRDPRQADEEKQAALDYLNALAADPNLNFLTEVDK